MAGLAENPVNISRSATREAHLGWHKTRQQCPAGTEHRTETGWPRQGCGIRAMELLVGAQRQSAGIQKRFRHYTERRVTDGAKETRPNDRPSHARREMRNERPRQSGSPRKAPRKTTSSPSRQAAQRGPSSTHKRKYKRRLHEQTATDGERTRATIITH